MPVNLSYSPFNSTARECAFLDGIVEGKWVRNHSPARAKEALREYLKTVFSRKFDHGVDAKEVAAHATMLLQRFK